MSVDEPVYGIVKSCYMASGKLQRLWKTVITSERLFLLMPLTANCCNKWTFYEYGRFIGTALVLWLSLDVAPSWTPVLSIFLPTRNGTNYQCLSEIRAFLF